jgi:hypothetical protein
LGYVLARKERGPPGRRGSIRLKHADLEICAPPNGIGEHGTPRIDTSDQVWFANDQLAVRFLQEIDFDYEANDATTVLLTAAS